MKFLLVFGLLFVGSVARGQGTAAGCSDGRYAANVFAALDSAKGVLFGQNSVRDYSQGTNTLQPLLLDFYAPANDAAPQRPLIIFAFGGSYVSGARADLADLCRAFARKGYATATIDYRLVPPGPNGFNYALIFGNRGRLADQLVRAVSDMKAAVRFFRRDAATANTYRVDPTRIFVAGYSAGAITASLTAYVNEASEDSNLTAAFAANGGIEGNTDLPSPNNALPAYNSATLSGALSLAGAVTRLSALKATDPPLYAAHATTDPTVPYNSGPAFGGSAYTLYGGGAMHARADSVGLTNQLYSIAGGGHGSTRAEPNRTAITTAAAVFFQSIICSAPLPVRLVTFTAEAVGSGAHLRWTTASEQNSDRFEVEASTDGVRFTRVGTVAAAGSSARARAYAFTAPQPVQRLTYYRLRQVDADGTATYSPVRTVIVGAPGLALHPNPAAHTATLSGVTAGASVQVYDAVGNLILTAHANEAGTAVLELPATLPGGLYLVRGGAGPALRLMVE